MKNRRFHVVVLREDGKEYHNRVLEWFQVRKHITLAAGLLGGLTLGTLAFFALATLQGNLVRHNIKLVKEEHQLKMSLAELSKSLDNARTRLSQSEQQLSRMEELARQQNLKVDETAGVGGVVPNSGNTPKLKVPSRDVAVKAIAEGISDLKEQVDSVYNETQDVQRILGPHLERLAHTPSIWPVKGFIASGFGPRTNPIGGGPEFHPGIDISAPYGSPVEAPADGLVIFTGWKDGYGKCIEISHGNGYTTRYGHLSKILVKQGQHVKRWQKIGLVGSTGYSTGPHLHYEVRRNDHPLNPKKFLLF
jgi:murein DD-endopeptidase MepM/ murein hydrolase activator NlpD